MPTPVLAERNFGFARAGFSALRLARGTPFRRGRNSKPPPVLRRTGNVPPPPGGWTPLLRGQLQQYWGKPRRSLLESAGAAAEAVLARMEATASASHSPIWRNLWSEKKTSRSALGRSARAWGPRSRCV